ncbi:MAG: hypothetical protein KGL39_12095 [Patescibacteria group bacterium]|nr:hypothetical protein [Patescibacteria group bacterium]
MADAVTDFAEVGVVAFIALLAVKALHSAAVSPLAGVCVLGHGPGCKPSVGGTQGEASTICGPGYLSDGYGGCYLPGSYGNMPGQTPLPAGTTTTQCNCDSVKALLTGCVQDCPY